MSHPKFHAAAEALRGDPAEPDYWRRLARLVWRYRYLPAGLQRRSHLSLLASLLRDRSDGPWVLPLLVHLLGLQVGEAPEAPGRYWENPERAACRAGIWIDRDTGLPLRVRRPRDGAEMALVPARTLRIGASGTRDIEAVYVDVDRRQGPDFDRYREATGGATPGQTAFGDTNAYQPAPTVEGYARWAGARVVRWDEMVVYGLGVRFFPPPMPDHDEELRAAAKARHRAREAAAAASTPYGIRDLRGSEWCLRRISGARGRFELVAVHRGEEGPPKLWDLGETFPVRLAIPALLYPTEWPDPPTPEAALESIYPHGLPETPGEEID